MSNHRFLLSSTACLLLLALACSKEEEASLETTPTTTTPSTAPAPTPSEVQAGETKPEPSKWSQAITPEERRASLERSMAGGEEPFAIDIHDLGGWIVDENEEQPVPDYILDLEGKEFIMRGFMMPDIDFEHIRQFHLVRSLYSCCFGAPPRLNEIVRVSLADKDGMEYTYNTVEVRGRLQVVFEVVDGLVEDIFRLENATYRILEFDDPVAPQSFDASTGFEGVIPAAPEQY